METIQEQLTAVQSKLNAERELGGQKDADKIQALEDQLAELTRQSLQERVEEQVKQSGYLLDTLTASNGLTMAELSYSPDNHELVAIAVQKAFLAQQDAFNAKMNAIEYELTQEAILIHDLNEHIEKMEQAKYQSDIEIVDLQNKLRNATDIIAENEIEIKQQAQKISALLEQQASPAIEVVSLSVEEQEAKLVNELNGKRIKVINMQPKSDDFNNKMFVATNAITGVEFEDYLLYSKRYQEISLEEAAQLQQDYRDKKEQIGKQNEPSLEVYEPPITLEETPSDTQQEDPHTDSEGNTEPVGNTDLEQVVEQTEEKLTIWDENEQVTFTRGISESIANKLSALSARIDALEAKVIV